MLTKHISLRAIPVAGIICLSWIGDWR